MVVTPVALSQPPVMSLVAASSCAGVGKTAPVESGLIMAVAGIGFVINLGTALLFMKDHHDLNARGAYLHMMADAGVSLGVVVSGGLILLTGWSVIDPAVTRPSPPARSSAPGTNRGYGP